MPNQRQQNYGKTNILVLPFVIRRTPFLPSVVGLLLLPFGMCVCVSTRSIKTNCNNGLWRLRQGFSVTKFTANCFSILFPSDPSEQRSVQGSFPLPNFLRVCALRGVPAEPAIEGRKEVANSVSRGVCVCALTRVQDVEGNDDLKSNFPRTFCAVLEK